MRRSEKTRQRGSGASEKRREKREARRREQSGVAFAREAKKINQFGETAASVGEKILPVRLAMDPVKGRLHVRTSALASRESRGQTRPLGALE